MEPNVNKSEQLEPLWNANYVKVWIANFMIFFSFMLLTPLLPLYLKDTFAADKQMIGIVLSGYTLLALVGVSVSLLGYLLFASVHNPLGYYGAALVIGLGNGHMWPAYQNMFINLAPHTQRGTANSSVLISWDVGMGLGILAGGVLSEHFGYHSAFWAAWIVNVLGVAGFFGYVRNSFARNKLR